MVTAKKASTPKTVAAAAPAVEKPVVAKKPVVKKPAAKKVATKSSTPALSAEQRNHYVEVAAFYIAERRGFVPGNPADDWCEAEREVDRLIASGHFN